jgi:hypothetical protein
VAPPARRSAQAHQPCALRRDAVGGNQLLLLPDRAEEAERVQAEAGQAKDRDRQQAGAGAHGDPHTLAPHGGREHEERQQQPRADLDADARAERGRGSAQPRAGARAQEQRDRQHQQHQSVVVRAAHRQHQQHRVQAHEGRRPAGRAPETPGRTRDQRDGTEARGDRQHLEHPQSRRQPQWRHGVADEREQGAVGRVLERPSHEREHHVGGRFGGHVGVGIESVQRSQSCEREVAEDVLGDQRGPEQKDQVGEHDRARERRDWQPRCSHQHQQVAGGHDQHQRLKAAAREAYVKATQRARQPRRPAARSRRDVLGRARCRARAQQERARQHPEQTERPESAHARRGRACDRGPPGLFARRPGDLSRRYRCCRLDGAIVAPPRDAGVHRAR